MFTQKKIIIIKGQNFITNLGFTRKVYIISKIMSLYSMAGKHFLGS